MVSEENIGGISIYLLDHADYNFDKWVTHIPGSVELIKKQSRTQWLSNMVDFTNETSNVGCVISDDDIRW